MSKIKKEQDFDKLICSFMSLLENIEYIHSKGIIHRDIKPDNIICRGNDVTQPVLIDFGTAFDNDDSVLTKHNDELGNRFLHLPELRTNSSNIDVKRDKVADLTFCIGIFFYLLTEKPPKLLNDENGLKPHERFDNIMKMQWIGTERLRIINELFDKGFSHKVEERFQCVSDIVFAINKINRFPQKIMNNNPKSFCLASIERDFDDKEISSHDFIQKISTYKDSRISLGVITLRNIENRYFIDTDKLLFLDYKNVNIINWSEISFLSFILDDAEKDNIYLDTFELYGKVEISTEDDGIKFTELGIQGKYFKKKVYPTLSFEDTFNLDCATNITSISMCEKNIILVYENKIDLLNTNDNMNNNLIEVPTAIKMGISYDLSHAFYIDSNSDIYTKMGKSNVLSKDNTYFAKWNLNTTDLRDICYMNHSHYIVLLYNNRIDLYDYTQNTTQRYFIEDIEFKENTKIDSMHFSDHIINLKLVNNRYCYCVFSENYDNMKIREVSSELMYFTYEQGKCIKFDLSKNDFNQGQYRSEANNFLGLLSNDFAVSFIKKSRFPYNKSGYYVCLTNIKTKNCTIFRDKYHESKVKHYTINGNLFCTIDSSNTCFLWNINY